MTPFRIWRIWDSRCYALPRGTQWTSGTHYTYTNGFRVNDRIFVSVYGTAIVPGGNSAYNTRDAEAMAIWEAAAGPGVEIVPIQCLSIIPSAGAIHCIVMQVPRYTGAAPAVNVVSPAGGELWLKGSQQTIQWSATDTNNTDPTSVSVYVSFNNGQVWRHLHTGSDTGSFTWNVSGRDTDTALIRVIATSADNDQTIAVSNSFRIRTGTRTVYDFSTGGGVDKNGWGYQTGTWNGNVTANNQPVSNLLSAGDYSSLAASDNTRYTAPQPSSGNESTHAFAFNLSQSPSSMSEIEIRWEGYAQDTTQVELYVWDLVAGEWGDGAGLSGQNRYLDNWAGYQQDANLLGYIRSDFSRYVANDGTIRVLVYAERSADATYHDFVSVAVTELPA